jgi:hypothetical protein
VWLSRPDEFAIDDLQTLGAIAAAFLFERLDQRYLVSIRRHYQLAASIVRDPMGRAKGIQARRAVHAELRFQ